MSVQPLDKKQPIDGYELRERIGAGGYGEVWKADAPGGLVKAIKFVYGYMDDVRAASELKALNRIKGVRHPFLLSLERIEIIDGQLIIVTELADACLKDRHLECCESGLVGIPRDELLVYMGDTADALDYMNSNCSLQHLDVKPENLLLVGGRVKVGDFGLVKSIHDQTVSLVGGLTPAYASPEVFDGKPSGFSDQYSLAIVYQQLLTSTLPFPGITPAQLAAQHLNARPQLTALPLQDQPVIARGLMKSPQQRFASCRELVDHLIEAGRSPRAVPAGNRSQTHLTAVSAGDMKTVAREGIGSPATTDEFAETASTRGQAKPVDLISQPTMLPEEPPVIVNLPPAEWNPKEARLRPTLYVGIGGTAAFTLRQLRRRLHDRFGNADAVPAVGMLLLDTDRKALMQATQGDASSAFNPSQTLALPLRRTQVYRRNSKKFLKWLSRRWLYNIPRSLETEGLRPLGRLAWVDHYQEASQRLSEAIVEISKAEAIGASEQAVGVQFLSEKPRVVLVTSICGGAGGGIVFDAAYAVRKILQNLDKPHGQVSGVLMYAMPHTGDARDLAAVNAYACLRELNHYSDDTAQLPGDSACGLQQSGGAPFDNVYLIHLGDGVTEQEFRQAHEAVSEYLYRDAVTLGGALLDKCREQREDSTTSRGVRVRTFGICRVSCFNGSAAEGAAELLCRAVVDRWMGEMDTLDRYGLEESVSESYAQEKRSQETLKYSQVARLASQCAEALGLDQPQLEEFAEDVVKSALGDSPEACCSTFVQQFLESLQSQQSAEGVSLMVKFTDALDRLVQPAEPKATDESENSQGTKESVAGQLDGFADRRGDALCDWLFRLVDATGVGAHGAQQGGEWLTQYLQALEVQAREKAQELTEQLMRRDDELRQLTDAQDGSFSHGRQPNSAVESLLRKFALCRIRRLSQRYVVSLTQAFARKINQSASQFRLLRRQLEPLPQQFEPPAVWKNGSPCKNLDGVQRSIAESLQSRMGDLVDELSKHLALKCFGESEDPTARNDSPDALAELLRQESRRLVKQAIKVMDVDSLLLGTAGKGASPQIKEFLAIAQPQFLSECGGARRLLMFLPEGADSERFQAVVHAESGKASALACDGEGDVVFCYEAENIPLRRAAGIVIEHRPDLPDVAARVLTRIDVSWKPLG